MAYKYTRTMALHVIRAESFDAGSDDPLKINAPLVERWLVEFLREECTRRRKFSRAVVGLSGGIDSAVSAYLCAKAFGPKNVTALRMPYRLSSKESLDHDKLVVGELGILERTVDITEMTDAYLSVEPDMSPLRLGNVCARCRIIVLFDQSAKLEALPIGTGNKTERLFGYFTWHADDSPPINPLGDLFKSQVLQLAVHLGVPEAITSKAPTADLVQDQTDEGDLGITYVEADRILQYLTLGYRPAKLVELGFDSIQVEIARRKVDSSHWKRRSPTTAMLSTSAIGEYYLRPVDYGGT